MLPWLVLPGTVALQPPPPAPGPARGCTAAEHRQFDFWVGDWDVHVNGKPAGRNRIERLLDGCALMEHWEGAGGSRGVSLNMYSPADGLWHQTWVDGQGGRLALSGTWDEQTSTMTLSGTTPPRSGGPPVRQQIAWTRRPDGSVRQHWRFSTDGGQTWTDAFDGIYTKRAK